MDRLELIDQQGHFYRRNFRRIVSTAFILVFIVFAIMGILIYQHLNTPIQKYFVTTSDGRLIEIQPIK